MFNSDSAYSNCSIAQVTVQTRNKITTYNTNHNDQHIISEQTTMTTSWNQPLWGKLPATSSWRSSASYRTTWYEILRDIVSIRDARDMYSTYVMNMMQCTKNIKKLSYKTKNIWKYVRSKDLLSTTLQDFGKMVFSCKWWPWKSAKRNIRNKRKELRHLFKRDSRYSRFQQDLPRSCKTFVRVFPKIVVPPNHPF